MESYGYILLYFFKMGFMIYPVIIEWLLNLQQVYAQSINVRCQKSFGV